MQGVSKPQPVDRFSRVHPPDAVRECMRELRRLDPHLLAIFNAWWFELKTEASAASVRRLLLAEGCEWVPKERRFREHYNRMRALVAGYNV